MRLSELSGKEVINLSDGARLGVINECELLFDEVSGRIAALILPNKVGLFKFLGEGRNIHIPWICLKRIGDEVVIVEMDESQERRHRIAGGLF